MSILYGNSKNKLTAENWIVISFFILTSFFSGCVGSSKNSQLITVYQIESLQNLESMLPLEPDSILARYIHYDTITFYETYGKRISQIVNLIDSLNKKYPESLRIDTLTIDRSFGSFDEAARLGHSIYISSSYFILYDDVTVLRSVIFHEFGHITYKLLDQRTTQVVDSIWTELSRRALLYLFREGEYSGNSRFGGHPEESPEEMYASAFNILNNRSKEFQARLSYVDQYNIPIIRRFAQILGLANKIFE